MEINLNQKENFTFGIIKEAKIVKLRKDFLGSSLMIMLLSIGILLFSDAKITLPILLALFSISYFFGLKLLDKKKFEISCDIYFISPTVIILIFGILFPQLTLEGLLFIPLIVDTFNYIDDPKRKQAQLITFSVAALTCLSFDFVAANNLEISGEYQIVSFLLLFVSIVFTAANIQNLLNAPSYYIPKLINAQSSLKENQARFEKIFENTVEGLFICDFTSGEIKESNPSFKAMVNHRTWNHKLVHTLFSERDYQKLEYFIQLVIDTDEPASVDLLLTTESFKRTKEIDVQCTIIPFDIKNNLVAISLHDISERLNAYRAKVESEALYRSLIESSSAGIIHTDLNGTIKFASKSAASIIGESVNFLIGSSISSHLETFMENDFLEKIPELAHILANKHVVRLPHFILRLRDGSIKHLEGTIRHLLSADNKINGVHFLYNDITELMDSQEKVLESGLISQAFFSKSFDGVDIIEITDRNPKKLKGRLVMRNENMFKIVENDKLTYLNYEEYSTIIKSSDQNGVEWRTSSFERLLKEIIHKRAVKFQDTLHVNGKEKLINCTYQLVEVGSKIFLVRIYSDITKSKKQEREIKRKNKELNNYIESNVSLSNFAAIASHDLKSPLRTIHSFAQLMNRREREALSASGKEFLDIILSSSNHLGKMVEDILQFSKVDTKNIRFSEFSAEKLVKNVLKDLKVDIASTGTEIKLVDLPLKIKGDGVKLSQVFSNLIRNAMKFRKEDDSCRVIIGCKDLGDYWKFYIKDNGIGISPANKKKIFQLFGRLHSQDEYEGSGIGLAICSKIINAHAGEIYVESELSDGSTFYFTIKKDLP